ncbi:protein Spindly-like isoform X2 [Periplaneta americana]
MDKQEYEQQIHELRNQLKVSELIHKEFVEDVAVLQKECDRLKDSRAADVQNVKREFALSLKELSAKNELLEQEFASQEEKHRTEIMELKLKMNSLQEKLEQVPDTEPVKQLELENIELRSRGVELNEKCKQLEEQNLLLSRKVEELTCTLDETKECLAAKQEDYISCSDSLQSTRDELAIMRTELEMLKSRPQSDGQKGNSIFAEVEDSRQVMKNNLELAVKKYRQMKKLYMEKCAEVSKCKSEYMCLCREWEKIQFTTQEQEKQLVEAHKARIKFLEDKVQKLESENPPFVIGKGDDSTLEFVEYYAESTRKECKKLKDELDAQSVCALFSRETQFHLERELHRTKAALKQYEAQVIHLQEQLKKDNKVN